MLILIAIVSFKVLFFLQPLSLFTVRFFLCRCLVSFWAFYNFSYMIFTSLSPLRNHPLRDHPLTNFGCAPPFILTVEGSLYTWSSKWCDLYPANQRWGLKVWVGVVSSFQLSHSVYLRRCRTGRVDSLLKYVHDWSMLKYVHNLKYLSKYHSKIFKLYLCEPYFTY
jgi:hypothetical protein